MNVSQLFFQVLEKYIPTSVINKFQNADKELLKGSGIFFLTKIIGIAVTYLFTWWVTTEMGAGKWGFITLMITTINVISIFCLFGLDVLLLKYTSEYIKRENLSSLQAIYLRTISFIVLLIILVVGTMAVFPNFFITVLYGSTAKMPWFIVALVGIPANVLFQINNSVLAGMKNMIAYGIFKNIMIFGLGLLIFFLGQNTIFPMFFERFMGGGILVLASYILAIYLGLFFNSIQVIKKLKLLKKVAKTKIEDVSLVREGFPLMLTASMSLVITTTDYFMLSHFYSQVEIGLYDIVVKVSILTAIILVAVNAIATPKFAEFSKHKDLKSLRIIVSQSSKLIFWGSSPVLIITLLFPKTVLSFFGEEFVVASNALIFLSLGQFVNSICGSVGNLLKMTNHQILFQNIVIAAAIINIILNLCLIPNYGINGAAFASFISISFLNLTAAYFALKRLKVRTIYLPIIFS